MGSNWELVRAIHSYQTKTPPHIVDLIAVQEILRLYVTGLCSKDIAKFLDTDITHVRTVLNEYYPQIFIDRESTLSFNPLLFYDRTFGSLDDYVQETFLLLDSEGEIIATYLSCRMYKIYEKEIDRYERN